MVIKKHNFIKYGGGGMTCRLGIYDENDRKIDHAKWTISDKESERKIFTTFKHKYNLFQKPNKDFRKNKHY